jgi:phosphoribosylglycinamide formyltransferase-1
MINMAIMASGSGTNAEVLIKYFKNHPKIKPSLVLSNKMEAGVLERSHRLNVPSRVFTKAEMQDKKFLDVFKEFKIDIVVLAGFLLKIPTYMIDAFPNKIINIHPALLPKYGGKGMYGSFVHEAVIENGDSESGITIHLVNEAYDEGRHLFQARVDVRPNETPVSLATKIHVLEHQHFPVVVEEYICDLFQV